MFEQLNESLTRTLQKIRGQGRLTEDNIKDTLREIRVSLLEADVALPVVKHFIDDIREQVVGQEIATSLNPGQILVKLVNQNLIDILGGENVELQLKTQPPAIILMAGLQGSGKTTTVAKLAKWLKEHHNKNVAVTSCDLNRPAAIEQLKILAQEMGNTFFDPSGDPIQSARSAIKLAKQNINDVLIIDTAGRLHIDTAMMDEIKAIHNATNPIETLFVVDSMTGQDAANTAQAFNTTLPITGVILTKIDGDARGGAALSVRKITDKPIKFIGTGEKMDALEVFHPDRIASRILGMGDVLSIVEEAERKIDKKKTAKMAKKLRKGKSFDFDDFKEQILQMNKLGGISGLMSKLPGVGKLPAAAQAGIDDSAMKRIIAIIDSMTAKERHFPKLVNGSRKKRIARGSGTTVQDINRLLKQFTQMQKMIKKLSKPGAMQKMMQQFSQLT